MSVVNDPTHDPQSAAEARTIQWIAGALLAIVLTGGSFWLTFVAAQVEDLRQDQKLDARESGLLRERLRGVETKLEAVDATTKQTAEDVRAIRDALEVYRKERAAAR